MILVVSNRYPPDIVGGAEIVAASLCEGLAQRGHEVRVLTARPTRGEPCEDLPGGVKVRRVWPGNSIFPPEGLPRVRSLLWQIPVHLRDLHNRRFADETLRLCRSLEPDVVHTHNLYGLSPTVWAAAKQAQLPVVHTAHDLHLLDPTGHLRYDWERQSAMVNLFRAAYRRWYLSQTGNVDAFCAPSRHHLDLHRRLGCRAKSLRHVPNGVAGTPNGDWRIAHGGSLAGNEELRVLYMGRLESHKGVNVLLEAADLLTGSRVNLTFAGAGPLAARIRDAAARLPFVHCEGFVSPAKRAELFARTDLLVLPSTSLECFGIVVVEALAQGIPVLTVTTGGVAELVEPGRNGFCIPPGEPGKLADMLREIARDPVRARAMRDAARESAGAFTVDRMVEDYLEVYRDVSAR